MRLPIMIDLCCGTGGWSDPFLERGWTCIGFDVRRDPRYRGQIVIHDVRTLHGLEFASAGVIVASPPCTEFSRAKPENNQPGHCPDMSVVEACFRIARESGVPLVLENVHSAQKWLGSSVNHFGPFHLWGNGVPALLPQGPRWKDRIKGLHRSPHLRARIPEELASAIAHHYSRSAVIEHRLPDQPQLAFAAGAHPTCMLEA